MRTEIWIIPFVIVSLTVCFAESSVAQEENASGQKPKIMKDSVYNYTLQVVQSQHDLDLIYVSQSTWTDMVCHCLKASFIKDTTNGALRTVHCYRYIFRQGRPKEEVRKMVKQEHDLKFEVKRRRDETFLDLGPTADALSFDLEPEYDVLAAAPDCILLKVDTDENDKVRCMLWGVGGDHHKDDADCFDTMRKECTSTMTDVWAQNYDCEQYDNSTKAVQPSTVPTRR